MYKAKNDQAYYTNRHSCFLLQYHMVLVTKYRHPVIEGEIKTTLYQKIESIFAERNLNILEMNGESDHVHILFEADPFTAPGELRVRTKSWTSSRVSSALRNGEPRPLCEEGVSPCLGLPLRRD